MQVQTNSSYPFSNPFASSSYSPPPSYKEISQTGEIDQLKDDFSMISQELNPSERKLYNTLLNAENYQAAKGIVTIGFMRAAGIYHDSNGDILSGESLPQDLTKLYPPDSQEEQKALKSLQNYLTLNPSALAPDTQRRGSLLDLKI
ncbi:MAG: hypothetical protein A2023_01895 [Sulfuricurvum sp. GWF2_44_89]|uniref:Uncharacterized protein n=1 Tax=Sulfuricurvum kujiense TaxID=148813 RepID=A0A2D3WJR3_9BACT|nr:MULTISPECIES: hypothetical protein [Sulfuricurvum]OHD78212.1 MAG: hypothetical protein A2023_01895 [Sulfuricurvum sp. GWF2_44_89]OHD96371.1 MAG: hypothetical protein A2517_09915 [Sulfuricurvum sp. RIFOXYD12_FULL_44_77]OHD96768.1 MAG: hypothetical protein A2552_02765 [Sulfuricurvum sp. RIFOXYD2_FULL_44_160]DAB38536.1 MAG TPA: hypothetical protein CFH83_05465 [Sulfuricurvum kujiense]